MAYLTFDDGPSNNITPPNPGYIKKYDVKATFFIIGSLAEKYPELIKRIYEEGHSIGNHTYSHNYNHIYKKIDNLLEN